MGQRVDCGDEKEAVDTLRTSSDGNKQDPPHAAAKLTHASISHIWVANSLPPYSCDPKRCENKMQFVYLKKVSEMSPLIPNLIIAINTL